MKIKINNYFTETARLGSKLEFIGEVFYLPDSKCEYCGHIPISWCYVFQDENENKIVVGSECAKNLQNWGYAFNTMKEFRKKVELFWKLSNITSEEEKKKIKLNIKEIDAKIKEIVQKQRQEKQEDVEKQKTIIEKYKFLYGLNEIVTDILDKSEIYVLSDKQIQVLEKFKKIMLEKYGDENKVKWFIEASEKGYETALILSSNKKLWIKLREICDSIYKQKGYMISEKQLLFLKKQVEKRIEDYKQDDTAYLILKEFLEQMNGLKGE